jgi:anthranilate phosphoribosyltransferase
VSSKCGSADVFEAFGIHLEAPAERVVAALENVGLAFFFAPAWHPSMRHAGPTRRELGVRTAFNLLGPLTNPAGASRQVVGVSRPEHTELVARTLGELGAERAWVVHGAGGLDELSTLGHSKVSELRHGMVNTFWIHPGDVGLPTAVASDLAGGSAAENADIITGILAGAPGPRRDVVLLNAGAALLVAEAAPTLGEGIALAARTIDGGQARETLARLREACGR